MRRLLAILVVLLIGYPLAIHPTKLVAIVAGVSLALCALGITMRFAPVVIAGVALALGEYALALVASGTPPRLVGAVLIGVVAALVLEIADFERRFRDVAIAPGVIARQLRHWVGFAALAVVAAVVLVGAAGAVNAAVRWSWSPLVAALGAVLALGAVAVALRRA
jgi:hypothetical protein